MHMEPQPECTILSTLLNPSPVTVPIKRTDSNKARIISLLLTDGAKFWLTVSLFWLICLLIRLQDTGKHKWSFGPLENNLTSTTVSANSTSDSKGIRSCLLGYHFPQILIILIIFFKKGNPSEPAQITQKYLSANNSVLHKIISLTALFKTNESWLLITTLILICYL